MKITSGPYEGKILRFKNLQLYIFGHCLKEANLNQVIGPEDEFTFIVNGGKIALDQGDKKNNLEVYRAFLGSLFDTLPVRKGNSIK